VNSERDRKEELLGSPENAGARQRAVELNANGWQIETVSFRTGRWTFRRPRPADLTPSAPSARIRAVELMANGWHIETVSFKTGRWTFSATTASGPNAVRARCADTRIGELIAPQKFAICSAYATARPPCASIVASL
jgi:hypothetical protein